MAEPARQTLSRYRFSACLLAAGVLLAACAPPAVRVHEGWSGDPDAGRVFRDCRDCPDMVVIPAGRFVMGSPVNEAGRFRQEGPQREVRIAQSFALGRTEITRAQWVRFIEDSGHRIVPGCLVWNGRMIAPDAAANWRQPGFAQHDDHPAVCISQDDAQAYVAWLSRRTGKTYRLPAEEEWEYAARAGSTASRHWGDAPENACAYANVSDLDAANALPGLVAHPCADGHVFTAPVASLRPNAFGLYDTAGNAWEWTSSQWTEALGGPPSNLNQRVIRGGSWFSMPGFARSATRHRLDTAQHFADLGFRILREP